MLRELPFYDELNIAKTSKIFKGGARSYSIEIIDSKYLCFRDLFKDLINEIKGFKYQITLKVLLSKKKIQAENFLLFLLVLLIRQ